MFLGGTYYPLVQRLLLLDHLEFRMYHLATMRSITDSWTKGETVRRQYNANS